MGTRDTQNSSAVKPIEQVRASLSGKDDTFGEHSNQKKEMKKKKNKWGEVAEAYNEGLEKRELHVDHGEDDSGGAMMNLEKKSKNKNWELNRTEMNNAKDVQESEVERKLDGESNSEQKSTEDNNKERKKKKSKRKHDEVDFEVEGEKHIKESGQHSQNLEGDDAGKAERKKMKKEKEDMKDDNWSRDTSGEAMNDEGDFPCVQQECVPDNVEGKIESNEHDDGYAAEELERKKERKKKKKEHLKDYSPAAQQNNAETDRNGHMRTNEMQINSNPTKGTVERDNLVRGRRFTPEEYEIVKAAVNDYILSHNLGDEGLDVVLDCKKHRKVRGCWKEIGSSMPHRPTSAVYTRAHVLFRRSENRKWSEEEYEEVLKFCEEHDRQWRKLGDKLGKHMKHVRDTWLWLRLAKSREEKKSMHGMLRDNICWTTISDELSTRSAPRCCFKWYNQLTSSMVAQGMWADSDDYRLIGRLYRLDASCVEDVEWDGVVEGRDGDMCRKRWNQMALQLGRNGHKPFAEQVEVLAQRYCPYLLEAREAWDAKPRLP
ncbi:myb family transcription factor [Striga hermonthica]|uniref:Myb family transcription factor n=1 Tax=Striga hermonthica TaxID=68872 RepID=A0A9N7MK98_STRHE|nr:myb family transcription factor [Striga hermonthica]